MALSADQIVHALYQRGLDVGPNGGVSMRPGLPLEMRRDLARGFAMTGSYLSATESMLISEVRADLPAAVERHRAEESAAARRAYEVRRAEQAAKVDPKAAQPARQAPPVPIAPVSAMGMGDDLPFTPAAARVIAPGSPPPAPGPAAGATHRVPVVGERDVDAARIAATSSRSVESVRRVVGASETAAVDAASARGRVRAGVGVSECVPAASNASRTTQDVSSESQPPGDSGESVGVCLSCGKSLVGKRYGARACGPRCRKRLSRARIAPPKPTPPPAPEPAPVTVPVTVVTTGRTSASDAPPRDAAGLTTFGEIDAGVDVSDLQEATLLASGDLDLLMEAFE